MIAAIVFPKGSPVDGVLERAAAALTRQGLALAGFVQHEIPADGECCATMLVRDISGGGEHVISQALGREAKGCKLDPQALAGQAGALLARLEHPADVLFVHRFGKAESEGGGLRAPIEKALEKGVPVVLAVREDFRAAFEAYAGELAEFLPAEVEAIGSWVKNTVKRPAEPNVTAH